MIGEANLFLWYFKLNCDGLGDYRFGALGGLQRGVSGHDGYAAGIRAQINGAEIGVAGVNANVERIDAENFGDDCGEHVVRTLADFAGAGKNGDESAAI